MSQPQGSQPSIDVEKTIREYIEQVVHMSLATTVDDHPWVCEVHFSFDDDLHLYFRSDAATRHCQEIARNPNVAGDIVTQHFKNQRVRGVYFEGTAERLQSVAEEDNAYKAVQRRFGNAKVFASTDPDGPGVYKVTVKNWYLFDSYGPAPVKKHQLPWKTA